MLFHASTPQSRNISKRNIIVIVAYAIKSINNKLVQNKCFDRMLWIAHKWKCLFMLCATWCVSFFLRNDRERFGWFSFICDVLGLHRKSRLWFLNKEQLTLAIWSCLQRKKSNERNASHFCDIELTFKNECKRIFENDYEVFKIFIAHFFFELQLTIC